ncbi:pyridoxal phosphate-dependent aminotransferase [Microvirga thermotolerans]|uniref:8-amino-7-oxononanoate synthase n=1 Tax=Microvirga thermotolerans TaxID=2651334 RepID=A0A5P9JUW5_9HYPH|nr:pyridoxal phosphate-dependent aminotransferase [Microvirga thermotolerans]QFU15568.1 aminotransferase class I/II-fold pyridoxal phosphate-dependent enzyme [Microvirga thermotolerans]
MNASVSVPSLFNLRPEAEQAPASGIVDVYNYGRNREGLIPLWVGEGDLPTPSFICDAAARSLAAGETFYTYQRGIPELRQALARYHERVYGGSADPERFFVTSGGMPAMQIAMRMVSGPGDEVLVPTPAWPNFVGAITVAGARPVAVPMVFGQNGWNLDFERIERSVTPRTRAIVVNSPANPTGWTATLSDLRAVLDLARRHGLWIVADEIYGRFVHDPAIALDGRAPSFRDVMSPEDRILFVQTFSKNWAMTGWRLGWLEAPAALGQVIENLIQYQTSGTPVFVQRGGIAAIEQGEEFVSQQIARARTGREIVGRLAETGLVELPPPGGAFYAFFKVKGGKTSKEVAMALIAEANVGLAPGSAFGEAGEGYLRLCYARKAQDLEEAVRRIAAALPRIAG